MQMLMLEPKLAILDETDSGLDIDALKTVADGVNTLRSPDRSVIMVTHYQRLLSYIVPDLRPRAGRGPHHQVRRPGAGPGAGRERLRLAGHQRIRAGQLMEAKMKSTAPTLPQAFLADGGSSLPAPLQRLRAQRLQALGALPLPTRKRKTGNIPTGT